MMSVQTPAQRERRSLSEEAGTKLTDKRQERSAEPRLLFATTIAATVRAFLLPLATHFRQKGWRVDALAHGIEGDDVCRSSFDDVWEADWSRSPLHPSNLQMAKRIRCLVLEQRYDIVHVHTPVAAFVTRFALKDIRHKQQVKVLYTAHGFHFHPLGGLLRNRSFRFLEQRAASWTDRLIVINREDWKAAREELSIESDRLRLMPGIGVDRSYYSRSSVPEADVNRFYRERGISSSTPVLLMIAEFTKRKCHADALHAFSRLDRPQAHLVLAGSGPLMEAMKHLSVELGVADRVHFLGNRTDVPTLMKSSRALLLPSRQEGLPRCVLEALSLGVPVIGSRVRGTTELLERDAGLLVDVGNINELSRAMQFLIDDPAAAAAMGEAGQQQSEAYDLKHILRMHEDLYREALKEHKTLEKGPVLPQQSVTATAD